VATTLEKIAELSGVSRSTVSRVINDDVRVSAATRDRVLEIVEREGYEPNLMARSLASGRTNMIAVVVPIGDQEVLSDPYFSRLLHGVAREADASGRFVMLSLAEPGFRHRIEDVARQRLVDGVIFSASQSEDPQMASLLESGTQFVSVGRSAMENVSSVDVDNVVGARQATSHLIELGRRRVATISGPTFAIAAADRVRGYREALVSHGIEIDDELIVEGDFSGASGRLAMRRLLRHRPDAVFAASDRMAEGALNELRSAGLEVPEDVALVGFDDLALASQLDPPLTTIRQSPDRLGSAAVRLLLELLDDPAAGPRRVVLPSEIVVRASCGAHLNHERNGKSATN
jgi:LacI family transcriptional regulator